ncbi:MAG: YaaL family protein [Firmicutes bacterium]|nr:YaaL family protein [Bacillota bacterium]
MKDLSSFLIELSQRLLGEKQKITTITENEDHALFLLEKARQDWLAARTLFNSVCEKDLVDHAIYNLNAAERRYVFLLKEARKKNEK